MVAGATSTAGDLRRESDRRARVTAISDLFHQCTPYHGIFDLRHIAGRLIQRFDEFQGIFTGSPDDPRIPVVADIIKTVPHHREMAEAIVSALEKAALGIDRRDETGPQLKLGEPRLSIKEVYRLIVIAHETSNLQIRAHALGVLDSLTSTTETSAG